MTLDLAAFDQAYREAGSLAEIEALDELLREELEMDPESWARYFFPASMSASLADHHRDLWRWAWAIEAGKRQDPFAGIWARGAAKSSTAEMVVASLGARKRRRFVLYVSGTVDLAIRHVESIRLLLESDEFSRHYPDCASPQVGKFGNQRGWRDNRLVTAGGFTIDAVGLEQAIRGVRVGEDRPDMIVLDDVDDVRDTPKITQAKVDRVTRSLFPTGAPHVAILAVQNLILPNGVFARIAKMAEGADTEILTNAHLSGPIPAIRGLKLSQDDRGRWRVVEGEPTWAGQGIETCEAQIAEWGKTAWLIEAQHQVELRSGGMFKAYEWMEGRWVNGPFDADDPDVRRVRAWDTAGTEPTGTNDPDWTVGVLMALHLGKRRFRIEDVQAFRHTSGTVRNLVRAAAVADVERYGFDGITFGVEEEPGYHGRDAAYAWVHDTLAGFNVRRIPAMTSKPERAEGLAMAMENGLVEIVAADWTQTFLAELESFPLGDHDDRVDAAAHAYNMLRGHLIGGETWADTDQLTTVRYPT